MNIKCEVIRDLLPLYVDGVASEESRALIEEHLQECADCREYCRLLREEPPEVSMVDYADEVAPLKKIKRKINRNRLLIVVIVLAFAVAAGALLHNANLAEYEGSLEENLSYELPAGYEIANSNVDTGTMDVNSYVRETNTTRETIYLSYEGLDSSYLFDSDEPITLDDDTKYIVFLRDWTNDFDNIQWYEIHHNGEKYELTYRCQVKGKDNYYSSCSEKQQEEVIAFIKTFDYHRPANEDVGNVFQRLYLNFGVSGLVVVGLAILIFVVFPIGAAIGSLMDSDEKKDAGKPVVRSSDLLDSVNRDRERRGETTIPSINNVQGASSNNLARRDHSWSSVPDFFIKLFRRK